MRTFDYSFLKHSVDGQLLNIIGIIYDLRARNDMRRDANATAYGALRERAIIDSVSGSNAIEGIVSTREVIEGIAQGTLSPRTRDEREILGYKRALDEVCGRFRELDISEQTILHLHSIMLSSATERAGTYKAEGNAIQQIDARGRRSVRFRPVSAADAPEAMGQMLLAYYDARQDAAVNRLLLSFCLALDFLCIHPFTDGNGRLSRLMTSLALLREGFDVGLYASIEGKINENKGAYYDALAASSLGWSEGESDYAPFMTFMLQILYECYKQLDEGFLEGQLGRTSKSRRVEHVVANAIVPLSKQEICMRVPDVSVTTVERVLGEMVRQGRAAKVGSYRDARYMGMR